MAFALTEDSRVVIIGGGKMGEAILGGLIACADAPADCLSADNFIVADPGAERRAYLTETYGVACVDDASAVEKADLVVLSVKPQVMMAVLQGVCENPAFAGGPQGPLFVSIAAGLATARIEGALPADSRLVRVMPNTPLLVSEGAAAVCCGANASEAETQLVRDLFGCMGEACIVDESQMDAICAISGSGPAYVAAMIEALRDAGVEQGLDRDLAERMALQTVYGTSALILRTGQTPEQTRINVCSPGGTTLAALDAMQAEGFNQVFAAGVQAAVRRGEELGKL